MLIEILVFDGCPNAALAEKLVRETVSELGVTATLELIKVIDNDDAVAKRFLGSPSIRIDGKDLEEVEDGQRQYSMCCRVYRQGNKQVGIPSKDSLINALRAV